MQRQKYIFLKRQKTFIYLFILFVYVFMYVFILLYSFYFIYLTTYTTHFLLTVKSSLDMRLKTLMVADRDRSQTHCASVRYLHHWAGGVRE